MKRYATRKVSLASIATGARSAHIAQTTHAGAAGAPLQGLHLGWARRFAPITGEGALIATLFGMIVFALAPHSAPITVRWNVLAACDSRVVLSAIALGAWGVSLAIIQSPTVAAIIRRQQEAARVLLMLCLNAALALGFAALLIEPLQPVVVIALVFLWATFPALLGWRLLMTRARVATPTAQRAVIVGATPFLYAFVNVVESFHDDTMRLIGVVDDEPAQTRVGNALPFFCGAEALRSLIDKRIVDLIIVAVDHQTQPDLLREALAAVQRGVKVMPFVVAYERFTGKIPVESAGNHWYISLPWELQSQQIYRLWSRALDVIFGLIGGAALGILLAFLAPLLYLDSPGPLFYRQVRLGLHGKPITIFKIRTMRPASNEAHASWTQERDPRVTRIGRLLRATHLDELPQALNILRGDMSLIGPRPERPEFVKDLEQSIPFYRSRLAVKPGLTGWAQVMFRYGRTDTDALEKLQFDLYYIKHQSILLDLAVLIKTVGEVISLHGG